MRGKKYCIVITPTQPVSLLMCAALCALCDAQGVLSWVGGPAPGIEPPTFEARLYDVLFKTASVAETGDAWLEDLNPDSLIVVRGALATPPLAAAKPGARCAHPLDCATLVHSESSAWIRHNDVPHACMLLRVD
jgi:hypothetical protein